MLAIIRERGSFARYALTQLVAVKKILWTLVKVAHSVKVAINKRKINRAPAWQGREGVNYGMGTVDLCVRRTIGERR